jgi:hypothetical protein
MTLHRYLATLGLYGIWRKRDTSVLTQRRLLLGRGVINRRERCVPLRRMKDATFSRRGLSSYAEVTVEGERGRELLRIGPMSARKARRFTADLQSEL